jgi:D-xylose transport system permease protein
VFEVDFVVVASNHVALNRRNGIQQGGKYGNRIQKTDDRGRIEDPEAARLSGVNVGVYKMAAFLLCSATSRFAGILLGSRRARSIRLPCRVPTLLVAAILGGTSLFCGAGSVIKTLVGAMLLFTLTNGLDVLNLGANYQGLIEGTVVVTAAAIYIVGGAARRGAGRG